MREKYVDTSFSLLTQVNTIIILIIIIVLMTDKFTPYDIPNCHILDHICQLDMIKNTVKNCISLDDGIISNITEYQIENNIILTDEQIQEICNSRTLEKGGDLEEINVLFQQLHHNNQMIV